MPQLLPSWPRPNRRRPRDHRWGPRHCHGERWSCSPPLTAVPLADPPVCQIRNAALNRLMPSVPSKWKCVARRVLPNSVVDDFGTPPDCRGLRIRLAPVSRDRCADRHAAAESKPGVSRTQDLLLKVSRVLTSGDKQIIECAIGPNEVK